MDDEDREVLRLAGAHYLREGHRVDSARSTLGLGSVAFWSRVNRLIDEPAANLAEPVLCARLRRVRAVRMARRAA